MYGVRARRKFSRSECSAASVSILVSPCALSTVGSLQMSADEKRTAFMKECKHTIWLCACFRLARGLTGIIRLISLSVERQHQNTE